MKCRPLKEIAQLIGGYSFKSEKYVSSGLRVIRIANVQDGFICDDYPCFYPLDFVSELGGANLKENDLLMSLTGNVGRVGLIESKLLPAGLNQRVECIRPFSNEKIDTKFLYYFFKSPKFRDECIKNSSGSAQLNMSTIWLGNYLVPCFDNKKKKTMISTLDELTSKIENNKQELNHLNELAKSLFISMFGGIVERKTLEDLTVKITDGSHNPPKGIAQSKYMMLSSQNIFKELSFNDVRYLTKEDFDSENKRTNIQDGDVLLTIVGTVGRTHVVKNDEKFTFQRSVAVIKPIKNALDGVFLSAFFETPEAINQLESGAHGSSQKGIYLSDLKKITIPSVSYDEQLKFAVISQKIDDIKLKIQKRIALYQELFDKKMDEYFGGEE